MRACRVLPGVLLLALVVPSASSPNAVRLSRSVDEAPLPGTQPLTERGDLAAAMVDGIGRYLDRQTAAAAAAREQRWHRDFASPEAYARSLAPQRQRLREILGVVDERVSPPVLEELTAIPGAPPAAPAGPVDVRVVRWRVLRGVSAEGLLLRPRRPSGIRAVALPDCDETPEMLAGIDGGLPGASQVALRLAEQGCEVLVPALISRRDTFSGDPRVRLTNQPNREFLYRAAYEMGRHILGYEVQKTLAAVDWFSSRPDPAAAGPNRVMVFGYGEGGRIALLAGAVDERIAGVWVSGAFGPRESLWQEPIYRNVFGLLTDFGDAELASMVAPRALSIEASRGPEVAGPPPPRPGRSGAAPGSLVPTPVDSVRAEFERARRIVAPLGRNAPLELAGDGRSPAGAMGFAALLGKARETAAAPPPRLPAGPAPDPEAREKRMFDQILGDTQALMRESSYTREKYWSDADAATTDRWTASARRYRERLWDDVIGRLPAASLPPNARTRPYCDEPGYRGYEVLLDVWPDVTAYGILLVPRDIKPGQRRPVVVCQHGLEGRPTDVADPKLDNPAYHRYACRLAEQGYVTFAPQNPYIGQDRFRVLQRKANPIGKSLFSVIVRQHERILEWLRAQPFVDPDRIAFYGLSYGGKTAMRVPAMLEGYCLSICSADYNEWIWKNVNARSPYCYLYTGEYEMPEFNLGNTFNYAEMSWLIFPRPFMVERGHQDGVAPDEWVAYEFARTRRLYDRLGLADRTRIEFFNGPHTINGVGTFEFLRQHLRP